MKNRVIFSAGVLLSLTLIYLMLGRDFAAVSAQFARANYLYVLPCIALLLVSMLTRALRWQVLLPQQLSLWHSFHISNISYFVNSLLPLRAGDLTRAWMTTRLDPPIPAFLTLSTVVVERLFDLLALLGLFGLTLLLLPARPEIATFGTGIALSVVIGAIGLIVIAVKPDWFRAPLRRLRGSALERLRLEARFEHFISGLRPIGQASILSSALGWTVIGWLVDVLAGWTILWILFPAPSLASAIAMIFLVGVSMALPALPGNVGQFETGVVVGLWAAGLIASLNPADYAPAVAVGVTFHAATLFVTTLLGLIGLWSQRVSLRQVAAAR
ncbi:MAG: flippase-like domain-containing protein [Anaerolineae bacterium]|jgi:hypothetical protein|nr:flippase-like domain-containing protein [Anaerolineae bacterium]